MIRNWFWVLLISGFSVLLRAELPAQPVRALGEWEEVDSAVILWKNVDLVREVSKRQHVTIMAQPDDSSYDTEAKWKEWLQQNQIPLNDISFFKVKTNTFWVRDYQPWPILDGNGKLGMIHYTYNRPRPDDDASGAPVAAFLGIPLYDLGLIHTGGNYFVDGYGKGYSSTLIYTENPSKSADDVRKHVKDYLGITEFVNTELNPAETIQHWNTWGKLMAPDTWVVAQFPPSDSGYYRDTEKMVEVLKSLKSPYGTPYKIYRLYREKPDRGYINSYVSNHALYYPSFGDAHDDKAAEVFQKALPGYEIIPVSGSGTYWGDAVHCRTNNFFKQKNIFLFPEIKETPKAGLPTKVAMEAFASPGASFVGKPKLTWYKNGALMGTISFSLESGRWYRAAIPAQQAGTKVSFYVEADDSNGVHQRVPRYAPDMGIDFELR